MKRNLAKIYTGIYIYVSKWKSLSHVWLFATPCPIQSMEFSRPESWNGEPFPSTGDLPNPGTEPRFPSSYADSLPAEPQGKPIYIYIYMHIYIYMSNKDRQNVQYHIIKKLHIKIIMMYHHIPIRNVKIQNTEDTESWWKYRETGTIIHFWSKYKMVLPLWKTVQQFLKYLTIFLWYNTAIVLLNLYQM